MNDRKSFSKKKSFYILDSMLNIQTKTKINEFNYNYLSRVGSLFFDYDFPLDISFKEYLDNSLWNYDFIKKIAKKNYKRLYNCKIIKMGDNVEFYLYEGNRSKKEDGLIKDKIKIDTEELFKDKNKILKEPSLQVIEERNMLRSKLKLQRLVKTNIEVFKTFITLTFDSNKVEIDINKVKEANKKFNVWRTKISTEMKKEGRNFKYICVPEFQKRGAVHYHLLTNIKYDSSFLSKEERKIWQPKSKKWQIGKDVKYWSYGFNQAKNLKNINVVGYISKYMTKNIDNRLFGHNRYLASRNLEMPQEIFLNLNDEKDLKIFEENILGKNQLFSNNYYDIFKNKVSYFEYGKD